MKRRHLLQGLFALISLPALPLRAATAATATTAATGAAGMAGSQAYLWAEFVTRVHNRASPAMLERLLKIDADTAARVYGELLRDNVITAPDAFGLSRATNPYPQARVVAGGRAAQPQTGLRQDDGQAHAPSKLQDRATPEPPVGEAAGAEHDERNPEEPQIDVTESQLDTTAPAADPFSATAPGASPTRVV